MELIGSILSNLRAAAPLLSYLRAGDGVSMAMTESKASPFHYVISGECRVVAAGQTVTLGPGDLALLPRGPAFNLEVGRPVKPVPIRQLIEARQLPFWSKEQVDRPLMMDIGNPPVKAYLLSGLASFGDQKSDLLLPHLPDIMVFRKVDASLERWLSAAADFITEEQNQKLPGYSEVAARVIELLLVVALRNWLLAQNQTGRLLGLFDPMVSRALLALHERPGYHWTLPSLAKAAGCSRAPFARRFHEIVGEPPFVYLTRLRMSLAAEKLLQTHQTVGAIAEEFGYSSSFAFSRAFTQSMGETPSAYRRARNEGRAA